MTSTGIGTEVCPKVTINIATLNEEKNIAACLESIFSQDYPKELIEVIIVDGGSTDRTLDIARSFETRIIENPLRTCPAGRRIGLQFATGELHIYLDADILLPSPNWLGEMVLPLMLEPKVVASFTRFVPRRDQRIVNRCLAQNELQLDPFLEFVSLPIRATVVKRQERYLLCRFEGHLAPPVGVILGRTEQLRRVVSKMEHEWADCDIPIYLCEQFEGLLAYVPSTGLIHNSYADIVSLLHKKARDIASSWGFAATRKTRKNAYLGTNFFALAKTAIWFPYALIMIPELARGFIRSVKYRDPAGLLLPAISVAVALNLLFHTIRTSSGRMLVGNLVSEMLERPRNLS